MRKPHWLWTTLALAALALPGAGCGDDDDGGTNDGGVTDGGGDGGDGGDGGNGGNGECDLSGESKDVETIPNPTGTMTLTSDKVWELESTTYVEDGDVLTIEPCTRIVGLPAAGASDPGTLVVSRGGKIMAEGTANEPILFTSDFPEGDRNPADWGGVILLGKAPTFDGDEVLIEGLTDAPENRYGGNEEDDDSGTMAYVRIEFGGYELMMANEINGLTMGGVGSETDIHHIMVNTTQDDCFEWFGGRVNAHHLICNGVGDDMFDADQGYQGELSYLFGRLDPDVYSSDDPNGFEMDSDSGGATPTTIVTVENATLCGGNEALSGTSFGMVLRENLEGSIDNVAVTGFDYGIDVRDDFGTPADPKVTLTNAHFFGMRTNDVRGEETGDADNDDGFDEDAYFAMGDGNEVPDTAPYSPEDCLAADGPTDAVTGSGIGAFDDLDGWNWDGLWIDWSTN